MADLITCPTCGAQNQEVGKYCEQCGSKVELANTPAASADSPAASADAAPADPAPVVHTGNGSTPDVVPPSGNGSSAPADAGANTATLTPPDDTQVSAPAAPAMLRFIRMENGVLVREQAFDLPLGSRLLVGRADPANGIFPEVDVTMWSKRVPTPEGSLYTVHRKQCYISRDGDGQVWIVDHQDYVGDTMVSPVGTSQFRPIPSFAGERTVNDEGGVSLEVGDRILMGQGEGMLIFQLMRL